MTSAELSEWMAFSLLEPFGETRADQRARQIIAMNLAGQGAKNVDETEFLRTWEPPVEVSNGEGLAALMAKLDAVAVPLLDSTTDVNEH